MDTNKRNRLRELANELKFIRSHLYANSLVLETREEEFAEKLIELDVIPDPECNCPTRGMTSRSGGKSFYYCTTCFCLKEPPDRWAFKGWD